MLNPSLAAARSARISARGPEPDQTRSCPVRAEHRHHCRLCSSVSRSASAESMAAMSYQHSHSKNRSMLEVGAKDRDTTTSPSHGSFSPI
jgi:hypothetical protein